LSQRPVLAQEQMGVEGAVDKFRLETEEKHFGYATTRGVKAKNLSSFQMDGCQVRKGAFGQYVAVVGPALRNGFSRLIDLGTGRGVGPKASFHKTFTECK